METLSLQVRNTENVLWSSRSVVSSSLTLFKYLYFSASWNAMRHDLSESVQQMTLVSPYICFCCNYTLRTEVSGKAITFWILMRCDVQASLHYWSQAGLLLVSPAEHRIGSMMWESFLLYILDTVLICLTTKDCAVLHVVVIVIRVMTVIVQIGEGESFKVISCFNRTTWYMWHCMSLSKNRYWGTLE